MSETLLIPPKPSFQGLAKKVDITKITVDDLRKKYDEFLKDDTCLNKIKAHDYGWLTRGFIVELFAPDFSAESSLAGIKELDVYRRYTGIAKILSASPLNEGERANLKEGDIIFAGDDLSNMSKNPAYVGWINAQPNQIKDKVMPIEFIRKVHRWIEGGMAMLVNRGDCVASKRGVEVSLETIGQYNEPLVFRLPEGDVLFKINGDPWA
jgi:hypothetical protein